MAGPWGRVALFGYERFIAPGVAPLHWMMTDDFFADLPAGCRVLDVGCGSGDVLCRLAARLPQIEALGVDFSAAQIVRARRRAAGIANVSFAIGDAMNLPLPDSSRDLVISIAALKFWPDPLQGLRELRRVCRPTGRVWIAEADPECSEADARAFTARWRGVAPGLRSFVAWGFRRSIASRGVSCADLLDLFRRAGFAEAYARPAPGLPLLIGVAGDEPLARNAVC
jgi:ubiquinone/menaquinone biosynthesis C-methylase UbiE